MINTFIIPILAILGTIFLILSVVIFIMGKNEDNGKFIPFLLSFIILLVGGLLIFLSFIMCKIKEPEAIDVYRNKTELVENGKMIDSVFVATDSVVVFKQ